MIKDSSTSLCVSDLREVFSIRAKVRFVRTADLHLPPQRRCHFPSSTCDVKTIGIAAAAVVGWGAAIYAFTDTAELQKQTDRTISRLQSAISTQQEAAGSVEELQAELASLETETQSLQEQRDGHRQVVDVPSCWR
jgi:uncharacterized protein HemX